MASTYFVFASGIANASNKNLIAVWNQAGGGGLVKIWRAWVMNGNLASVSGGPQLLELGLFSGAKYTGGTDITAQIWPMDLTNPWLASGTMGVSVAYNPSTITVSGIFRRITTLTDEWAASDATGDMLNVVPEFSRIWDSGYRDSDIQPLTLASGMGFVIHTTASAGWNTVGAYDILLEFSYE